MKILDALKNIRETEFIVLINKVIKEFVCFMYRYENIKISTKHWIWILKKNLNQKIKETSFLQQFPFGSEHESDNEIIDDDEVLLEMCKQCFSFELRQ